MLDASTRLRNAIVSGNLSLTKRLLGRFPELWLNIDPSHDGWCNLHYAAYHGHYLICFHLISTLNKYERVIPGYGTICDIDLVTFDNMSVFHMPLEHNYSQTLHYLLQTFSGSQWLNQKAGPGLRTPLHNCCVFDFVDGLNLFLEFGADWSVQDSKGDTCLHICFARGNLMCIQELIKGIATRKTIALFAEYDNEVSIRVSTGDNVSTGDKVSTGDNAAVPEIPEPEIARDVRDLQEPTLISLVKAIDEELELIENIQNNCGFTALDQALTEKLLTQYKTLKRLWITSCVESELALREPTPSIISSCNITSGTIYPRPRILSTSSSVSSSLANIGKALSRSSLESETPPPIINNFDNTIISRELTGGSRLADTPVSSGRKHLSSLPSSSQPDTIVAQVASEKIPAMRKHSKSLGYGYRTSPSQLRTPKLNQPPIINSMSAISPHPLEFNRTQSLKSITISPLSRHNKRGNVEDLTEESELEESVTLSDSSVTSNTSSVVVTPTSSKLLSQQFFLPLNYLRRNTSGVSSQVEPSRANEEEIQGMKSASGKQFHFSFFKRNLSTPAFSLDIVSGVDNSPNKSSRRNSHTEAPVKPALSLVIPNSSASLTRPKKSSFSPSSASIHSDDAFESSPSTLTPYRIKPFFSRPVPSRVGSILEATEEISLPLVGESVNSITFTRVRGDVHS